MYSSLSFISYPSQSDSSLSNGKWKFGRRCGFFSYCESSIPCMNVHLAMRESDSAQIIDTWTREYQSMFRKTRWLFFVRLVDQSKGPETDHLAQERSTSGEQVWRSDMYSGQRKRRSGLSHILLSGKHLVSAHIQAHDSIAQEISHVMVKMSRSSFSAEATIR